MISLPKFHGALGNQMFQYAYIRSQAKRLGTKFYCSQWLGDEIFDLMDQNERTSDLVTDKYYREPPHRVGFHKEASRITDSTAVEGYFQTDRYFERQDILNWFNLRRELVGETLRKYPDIVFKECTAIHLRIGDDAGLYDLNFYYPRKSYFRRALELIGQNRNILIFSDRPDRAKKYLSWINSPKIFIEGNKNYEDLYLISLCRNVICSPSSFSWWGAYLNQSAGRKIIFPEIQFIPGATSYNPDILPAGWIRLRGHIPILDHKYVRFFPNTLRRIRKKLGLPTWGLSH